MCTRFFVPSTSVPPRLSGENEPIDQSSENNNAPVALLLPIDQNSYTKPPSSKSVNTIFQPPPLLQNPLPEMAAKNHPHMAEDEMEAWLDYPIEEFYSELLHPNSTSVLQPPVTAKSLPENCSTPQRLPVTAISLQEHRVTLPQLPTRGFKIPRSEGNTLSGPLETISTEITVVGSNDTPVISGAAVTKVAPIVAVTTIPVIRGVGDDLPVGESGPQEGLMSTPMSTSATNSTTAGTTGTTTSGNASVRTNKRKIRDSDEKTTSASEPENKSLNFEKKHSRDFDDKKKHLRSSTASKKSRAAEVHNLSERRRRDRINKRMMELQELIPRCNKSDKASMLVEAIQYMKSLQMQVQMMSSGYGMMPMTCPGMQMQYMPPMGATTGIGMSTDMNRPVIPYPTAVPARAATALSSPSGSSTPAPTTTTFMPPFASRFPVPPFIMPGLPSNPADSTGSLYPPQIPGMGQVPNMVDPFSYYLAYQQMQMQMQMQMHAVQSQTPTPHDSSKPSPKGSETDDEEDD